MAECEDCGADHEHNGEPIISFAELCLVFTEQMARASEIVQLMKRSAAEDNETAGIVMIQTGLDIAADGYEMFEENVLKLFKQQIDTQKED